jgi:hypothetical protein
MVAAGVWGVFIAYLIRMALGDEYRLFAKIA